MSIFSKRIKELRILNNLTQKELAELLGISYSAVGQWESGRNTPTAKMLEKIADILKTDVNYLLGTETVQQSLLEKRLIQAGLKDKLNNLTPEQCDILISIIKNFKS
jgi:transcriptional regulator with XRE-family HTH domain